MKKLILSTLCMLAVYAQAHNYGQVRTILLRAAAPAIGTVVTSPTANTSIDAYVITCTTSGNAGQLSASIDLFAYNSISETATKLATLPNSGAGSDTTVIAGNVPWKYFYVQQTAISGTGAETTCTMAY